jgi:5-methyltetrahydrofolate--homocysteine methyltransferase
MGSATTDDLIAAILEMREDDIRGIVEGMLADGVAPTAVIGACREAMSVMGRRFEAGEAGEMMKSIAAQVRPHLVDGGVSRSIGCVVLGTVQGDIHDIGKDLVGSILDAAGFEVVDLGVDVPAERFIEAILAREDCIVALSCLLTTGFDSMRSIIAAIRAAVAREGVKIMVGGAPISAMVGEYVGADGWGADAATALELAKNWASTAAP